jgi:hypothetical protein
LSADVPPGQAHQATATATFKRLRLIPGHRRANLHGRNYQYFPMKSMAPPVPAARRIS